MIEADRGDGARADIRAVPAAGVGHEFKADAEIGVFHGAIVCASTGPPVKPGDDDDGDGGAGYQRRMNSVLRHFVAEQRKKERA